MRRGCCSTKTRLTFSGWFSFGRYLHRKLNFYEEVSAPDVAATNFLVPLTKSRKKQPYSIFSFVNGVVTKYEGAPDGQRNGEVMYIGASPDFTNSTFHLLQWCQFHVSSNSMLPLPPWHQDGYGRRDSLEVCAACSETPTPSWRFYSKVQIDPSLCHLNKVLQG